jgi:hypothetical protein
MPYYRAKKTTGPAPAFTNKGAGPRAFPNGRAEENPRDGVVSATADRHEHGLFGERRAAEYGTRRSKRASRCERC